MKNTLALIAAIVLMAVASRSFAQNARIATTITTEKHDPNYSLGRDFWFAPAQNYVDESGKYIMIYITSPNNTTAFIQAEGTSRAVPIPAYGVAKYSVQLELEMKSSGIVENKAIHVYDKTDDIAVYLMSHNPYSSDGMYCIPTIGWGTDYVVASFESLFATSNGSIYDFPSEFTITVNQDNTTIDITPSTGLRAADIYPDSDSIIAHPKGEKFSVTLNRGQCVQYQAVVAEDSFNYDVTGTIIHSNNAVGVVGASMCAQIPVSFPYCDYITDMIPPVRTWGETYYTTNPIQPEGDTTHNFAMYLMISSVPNQVIKRFNLVDSLHTVVTLGPTYDHYFIEVQNANKFFSDAPFLLVQYINSGTYPGGVQGNGDPAEVVVPAKENFAKSTIFVAPVSVGAQVGVDVFANIIANVNDRNVTYDGKSISGFTTKVPIDDTFEIYIVPHVGPGAHHIASDSGVAVYGYGYGYDETFAWGAPANVGTFNSSDNTPPVATVSSQCFATNVHLADSGSLQTTLSDIRLDSDINMAYMPDQYPSWFDGVGFDTSGYSMYVLDETKPALLKIDAFDYAGNRTTLTSIYSPLTANIEPALQNFGIGYKTSPRVVLYDTLINSGQVAFAIEDLRLLYGNRGFTIDSADTKDPLAVGEKRLIKISFSSVQTAFAVDTVIFGDDCTTQTAALLGFSGAPDFFVSDVDWVNVPLNPIPGNSNNPKGWTTKVAVIHNVSPIDTIHVSNAGWGDHLHFAFADTLGGIQTFPITMKPSSTANVWFWFEPTAVTRDTTLASWTALEVLDSNGTISPRFNRLIGDAGESLLKFTGDTSVNLVCTDTSVHSIQLAFVLSNIGTEDGMIKSVTVTNPTVFTYLTGHDQHGLTWDPTDPSGYKLVDISAGEIDTFIVTVLINATTNSSGTTLIIANLLGMNPDTLTATVNVSNQYADISSDSIDFGIVPWKGTTISKTITITDTSSSNLEIYSFNFIPGFANNLSYSFTTSPQTPDTLTPGQSMTVTVTFDPSVSGVPVQNSELLLSSDACNSPAINLSATLSGSSVAVENTQPSQVSIVQLGDGRSVRVIIPSDWTPPVHIDIYNIIGETVYTSSFDGTSTFDIGDLGSGVYFYRLRDGGTIQTGKIMIVE